MLVSPPYDTALAILSDRRQESYVALYNCWSKRCQVWHCIVEVGSVYHGKSDAHKNQACLSESSFALTSLFRPANHFINFFLKKFGKEYTRHAEIVKEVKQRNDDIYWKMMVGRVILSFDFVRTLMASFSSSTHAPPWHRIKLKHRCTSTFSCSF